MNRAIRLLMLLLIAVLPAAPAWAAWPEKPIRIIVPFAPGSMGDVLTRLISEDLAHNLGQPVIVDNKAGASGNIGAAAVAHALPDGYTLLVGATNNFVINQFLLPQMTFDPLKAFEPITIIADVPGVIFMNAQVPAKAFAEFVNYAKANRGKVSYGSPGVGTVPHLFLERTNRELNLGMTHVPYKGSGQGMNALLANEVQIFYVGPGVGMPHVQTGRLRALAVATIGPNPSTPDTPPFPDVGLDPTLASGWWGMAAPAGTPPAILEQINEAVRKTLATPAVKSGFAQRGAIVVANTREEMARQLTKEAGVWSRVIKDLDLKIE